MVLQPLPVFEEFQPHLPHCTLAHDLGAHSVLGAAPALSQLHVPHDQVRIISHRLEQRPGIRNDGVAACSAVAATASNPMKREPSPPSVSEEGLKLS